MDGRMQCGPSSVTDRMDELTLWSHPALAPFLGGALRG